MNTAWFSLKRRLLMLLLGGVAAAWLGTFVFSYFDAHHEVDELFDAQMAQAAQTLLALANHDKVSPIENLGEAAHKYQRRLRCQLWNAEGRLLMRSQSAPETPLTAVDGFSETDDATAGHWRHYSQWNAERTVQVQVSEPAQAVQVGLRSTPEGDWLVAAVRFPTQELSGARIQQAAEFLRHWLAQARD